MTLSENWLTANSAITKDPRNWRENSAVSDNQLAMKRRKKNEVTKKNCDSGRKMSGSIRSSPLSLSRSDFCFNSKKSLFLVELSARAHGIDRLRPTETQTTRKGKINQTKENERMNGGTTTIRKKEEKTQEKMVEEKKGKS